ncbi:hypothetical protein [Pseudaminobacter sp. NGMCC 1.201702]|uniref:hypothetical protein n=1 Tax=Pseudaminobacter sp. NGMCC 1.201702 TaxID=3391825 RepID=UPI0039EF1149
MASSCLLAIAMLASSHIAAVADCQCLANGRKYHHGEVACLKLPTGDQLARCDMVLNNSAWKKVSDGCPQAEAVRSSQAPPGYRSGLTAPIAAPLQVTVKKG